MIYKYCLPGHTGETFARMPRGARLLHVHEQYGELIVWALVDPDARPCNRSFAVVGTGQTHPTELFIHPYVGTAHIGPFVWHVFDLGETEP